MKIVRTNLIKYFKCVTILSWLFTRKNTVISATDFNHECIHEKQWYECLIIFFPILYLISFLIRFIFTLFNFKYAYRSIPFEREAYDNENNFEYLNTRKRFSWIKYLFMP